MFRYDVLLVELVITTYVMVSHLARSAVNISLCFLVLLLLPQVLSWPIL
jgi:hypothetical protein